MRYDGEGAPAGDRRSVRRDQGPHRRLVHHRRGLLERAVELAGELSAAPGPGGKPIHEWLEVRPFLSGRPEPERVNESLLRELVPAVIGILVRRGADFASAEDAVQEALIRAWETWPDDPPRDPQGWLVAVAWRKFLDAARAEAARRGRGLAVEREPPPGPVPATDDTLRLYFWCAHPALPPASAVALTLRAVGGLTTRQIAAGVLRARGHHGAADQPGQAPVAGLPLDQPGDLATVLRVLYLVFNEGYGGDVDLATEAIRLTRQLVTLTDEPEVAGLLALMLLHHARRASRTGPDGRLVPLAEQDRSRWDTRMIAEGVTILQAPWPVTGSASTRRRRRSPPCTRTPGASRRQTGCRSWSGTTSCSGSPAARWCGSTARWRSARPTARRRGWRRWPRCRPDLPRYTAAAAYLHERAGDLGTRRRGVRRGGPRRHQRRRSGTT